MKKIILTIVIVCAIAAVAIVGLLGLGVFIGYKQTALLSQPPEHGTSFVVEVDLSQVHGNTNVLANLQETMNRRFNRFGTRIFLEPVSESRIRIVAPITDEKQVAASKSLISRGGVLAFRLVHENSDQIIANGENLPAGYELLKHQEIQASGQKRMEMFVVKREPEKGLSGDMIKSAMVIRDPLGQPVIDFELNPESTTAFAAVTRANIGHQLAIVLDGQLCPAPKIQSSIESGAAQISGHFDEQEASLMTTLIEHPLPAPVTLVESKTF
jgi:SecD/SecF fusion protein